MLTAGKKKSYCTAAPIRGNTAASEGLASRGKLQSQATPSGCRGGFPSAPFIPQPRSRRRLEAVASSHRRSKLLGGIGHPAFQSPIPAMGLATERFAEPVDPELRCKLCGQVLDEPLSAPCGHVFCASCLLPWAARRRRCPLCCQPIRVQELHRVLPLRNLVNRLPVKCDYSARGCQRHVLLRQLAAHVEHCAFSPARLPPRQREAEEAAEEEDCAQGLDLERHRRGSSVSAGCGLAEVRRKQQQQPGGGEADADEGSASPCSPGALGLRRNQSSGREQELRRRSLWWRQGEQALLGQLAALQSEVQLTALKYKRKLSQYVSHLGTIPRDLGSGPRSKVSTRPAGLLFFPLCWRSPLGGSVA